ncbi:MAG: SPOR domain-containing protein [Gemmatimonadota bacterium]|nr:SPOR domain-containing protein [Gemmatimonadota bacterium]
MTRGMPLILLAALLVGCASAPPGREEAGTGTREDRTGDPEFVAAREAADPEFETQADALAAGVYERFVHPDSVRPAARTRREGAPAPAPGPDPSTEELLETLDAGPRDGTAERRREPPSPAREPGGDFWTLQVGAFETEVGALARIRQLERIVPGEPRWYAVEGGLYRVFLGRYGSRRGAELARERIAARGLADVWVRRAP